MLEEQCHRKGYKLSVCLPVTFTESCVSFSIDPNSIYGWEWCHRDGIGYNSVSIFMLVVFNCYNNSQQISVESIDYYKIMGCDGGEVSNENIEVLKLLEENNSYPPRFQLHFRVDRNADHLTKQNVTVNFYGLNPSISATIVLKMSGIYMYMYCIFNKNYLIQQTMIILLCYQLLLCHQAHHHLTTYKQIYEFSLKVCSKMIYS